MDKSKIRLPHNNWCCCKEFGEREGVMRKEIIGSRRGRVLRVVHGGKQGAI